MSWSDEFASGLFALIYARRDCFAEGELWQTFCSELGVCLCWSIRCDVELVWSCYASVATVSLIVAAWTAGSEQCYGFELGYILYICLGSELWAEAIICCWAVAVGISNMLVWAKAVALAVHK